MKNKMKTQDHVLMPIIDMHHIHSIDTVRIIIINTMPLTIF